VWNWLSTKLRSLLVTHRSISVMTLCIINFQWSFCQQFFETCARNWPQCLIRTKQSSKLYLFLPQFHRWLNIFSTTLSSYWIKLYYGRPNNLTVYVEVCDSFFYQETLTHTSHVLTSSPVSTWMGDRQEIPSTVNLCPFVGVDLNLWPTISWHCSACWMAHLNRVSGWSRRLLCYLGYYFII